MDRLRTVAGITALLSFVPTPGNIMHSTADPLSLPSGWKLLFLRPAPRQRYASKTVALWVLSQLLLLVVVVVEVFVVVGNLDETNHE